MAIGYAVTEGRLTLGHPPRPTHSGRPRGGSRRPPRGRCAFGLLAARPPPFCSPFSPRAAAFPATRRMPSLPRVGGRRHFVTPCGRPRLGVAASFFPRPSVVSVPLGVRCLAARGAGLLSPSARSASLFSGSPVSARSPLARRRRGPPAVGLLWSSLAPFIARRAAAVAGVPSLGRCARPVAAAVAAMPPSPLRRARALPSPLALLGRAASRSAALRSSPRALRPLPLPPCSALSRPVRLPSAGSVGLRPPSPAALVAGAAASPPRLALR